METRVGWSHGAALAHESRFLSEGSELYQLVQKLVPWWLLNVQVAYLLKAKRIRSELGSDLHRCTAIFYTDGAFTVESEYLPESQAPHERFVKPVRLAVFVLGKAPTDDTQSSEADAQPARARRPECRRRDGRRRQTSRGLCSR